MHTSVRVEKAFFFPFFLNITTNAIDWKKKLCLLLKEYMKCFKHLLQTQLKKKQNIVFT